MTTATLGLQTQIRELIAAHGLVQVSKMLGIGRETLARMAAGIPVKPVSLMAATAVLASRPGPMAIASVPSFGEAQQG